MRLDTVRQLSCTAGRFGSTCGPGHASPFPGSVARGNLPPPAGRDRRPTPEARGWAQADFLRGRSWAPLARVAACDQSSHLPNPGGSSDDGHTCSADLPALRAHPDVAHAHRCLPVAPRVRSMSCSAATKPGDCCVFSRMGRYRARRYRSGAGWAVRQLTWSHAPIRRVRGGTGAKLLPFSIGSG
jgi:hypothetical protein